jgi:hypothetical protein
MTTSGGHEHPTEAEVRAFVGSHANYYLKQWRHLMEGLDIGADSHLASFLFPLFWLPYRKLWRLSAYSYGAIVLSEIADRVLFSVLLHRESSGVFLRIAILVLGFICAWSENDWYFRHMQRAMMEVRALGSDDYLNRLSRRGGTSPVTAIVWLTVLFALYSAIESLS